MRKTINKIKIRSSPSKNSDWFSLQPFPKQQARLLGLKHNGIVDGEFKLKFTTRVYVLYFGKENFFFVLKDFVEVFRFHVCE